ncbi:hypothetical protein [Olleya sp. ITB9]|uniref:hypothetical protein n=1 Tax=Olleya sp. ITB9 TaxID=1715648 RepID=UPI0006D151AD|nr:hypothetical protein [Olleya sp. ITB9]
MKKIVVLIAFVLCSINSTIAQEWLTSYTLAKKLALVKNKMMLVIWEDAANYSYPLLVDTKEGSQIVVELFESDKIKQLVWEYFVPVIINESNYDKLYHGGVKNRRVSYIERFNDDKLKVMDPNGNILNLSERDDFSMTNMSLLIQKYALDTSFLSNEMKQYFEHKNYASAFRLANRYLDFAMYAEDFVKEELIALSDLYMDEATDLLKLSDIEHKEALHQKQELLKIEGFLIIGKFKKARRFLKKHETESIDDLNQSLFSFLNYVTFRGLDDMDQAIKWRDSLSQSDLNKVELLLKK